MVRKGYRIGIQYLAEPYRTIVSALLRSLLDTWGDKLVSLTVFGSVARGDARPDSDIDLLIVGRDLPKSRIKRQEMFMLAEDRIENICMEIQREGYTFDFSPIILDTSEALRIRPLYLDLVEDAVIVYDRDRFIEKILESLYEKLDRLGAKRIWIGKRWYWDLKPDYSLGEVIEL